MSRHHDKDDRTPTEHELVPGVSVVVFYRGDGEWRVNGHEVMWSGGKKGLLADLRSALPKWLVPATECREPDAKKCRATGCTEPVEVGPNGPGSRWDYCPYHGPSACTCGAGPDAFNYQHSRSCPRG